LFGVLFTGVSWLAFGCAVLFYLVRMFFVTAFYHRYFSHRAFKSRRWFQFIMGFLGCTAGQRGPMWWASHHRQHHSHSDTPQDPHSPDHKGLLYSHTGWFLTRISFVTNPDRVKDWLRFPELRLLERLDWLPLVAFAFICYELGEFLQTYYPQSSVNGWQMLVWGFFISTVVLYHATYSINSLAHRFGTRRFETNDNSRNNIWLALITLGEGWHNNHHRFPGSARQGIQWWELDMSYWGLLCLRSLGLVHDLRLAPVNFPR